MTRPLASVLLISASLWFTCAPRAAHGALDHHELSIRLDPQRGTIRGSDEIRLHSAGRGSFALAEGLIVDRVLVDGTPVEARSDDRTWHLDPQAERGSSVFVEFHGRLRSEATDEQASHRIDASGTYLLASGWYPAFGDSPISFAINVEIPAGQIAVSTGRLVRERTDGDSYRARFVSEGPAEEIVLFAAAYRVTERGHRGRRLRTYLHDEVADLADSYLSKTADYLELYEDWIGAYPYSGFRVVSGPLPVGLGFPGLTYIGTRVLRLPFIPETSLGHEVLHSWWGNAVSVARRRGNWAEGLTTFMADYTFAELEGGDEALQMRLRWLREYAALPETEERPLTAFRGRRHSASQVVGYHKAAMVFLMLRDEIGREAFDEGVRAFWQARRFRTASWTDLRTSFEAVAGRSLAAYFSQWVERSGAPELTLSDVSVERAETGSLVSFTLEQKAPAYRLRIPVETRAGHETTAHTVRLDERSQSFQLRVDAIPSRLEIDPSFRLFRRLDSAEAPPLLRGVVFDSAAAVVIAARAPQLRAAARDVAERFLEHTAKTFDAGAGLPGGALLVIGSPRELQELLAGEELVPAMPSLAGEGTARAWAARRPAGEPIVIVSAAEAEALRAVAAPLPHYGSFSYVVFSGRRAIRRGVWAPRESALRVDLSP